MTRTSLLQPRLPGAACDLAVVQGGLTTTVELTAARRPFLYFPLRHHFEQNFHVRHRLDRHRAGRCMDYATADPEAIAAAIVEAGAGDNHHLVCRSCGAIADVECTVEDAPCLTAGDDAGYAIDEAEVIYWGECPTCLASSPAPVGR